jgi:hypothetical protein
MISFTTTIQRDNRSPDKSGWSFIILTKAQSEKLNPGSRKSFRVKGVLDEFKIERTSVLPIGGGRFMLPINGAIRKGTGKAEGDRLRVQLSLDERSIPLSKELLLCLKDDQKALTFFKSLPKGHQTYFSKWIEGAKTIHTKTKRITMALIALGQEQGYSEMMQANKKFDGISE